MLLCFTSKGTRTSGAEVTFRRADGLIQGGENNDCGDGGMSYEK